MTKFKKGQLPWNKGLTITDERVKKYSLKVKGKKRTEEQRKRISDGVEHVKVLQESGLDWTIVRVLKLSKSDAEANDYKLNDHGPAELLTSRKKVAKVLVDLLDDTNSYGKLPVISG